MAAYKRVRIADSRGDCGGSAYPIKLVAASSKMAKPKNGIAANASVVMPRERYAQVFGPLCVRCVYGRCQNRYSDIVDHVSVDAPENLFLREKWNRLVSHRNGYGIILLPAAVHVVEALKAGGGWT